MVRRPSCSSRRPSTLTRVATGTWSSVTKSHNSTRLPRRFVYSCVMATNSPPSTTRRRSDHSALVGDTTKWAKLAKQQNMVFSPYTSSQLVNPSTPKPGVGTMKWWARRSAPSWTLTGRRKQVRPMTNVVDQRCD